MSATERAYRTLGRLICCCLLLVSIFALSAGQACSADLVRYALCDVRVLYFFDEPSSIDWPTLYYLNDNFGCRIDLLTLGQGGGPEVTDLEIDNRNLYLHTVILPENDSASAAYLLSGLFQERLPDIVILAAGGQSKQSAFVERHLIRAAEPSDRMFGVLKVYRTFDAASGKDPSEAVVLNSRELFNRYRDRMRLELPDFFPRFDIDAYPVRRLVHYELVRDNLAAPVYDDNFLSGISPIRLVGMIDSLYTQGPMKEVLLDQARKYISNFSSAQISLGSRRVAFIVDGYRELRHLNEHERAVADQPEFAAYLQDLLAKGELAALDAVGINWDGRIVLRDSPHGPTLKFRASVSADGPQEIEITALKFHPYWDSSVVILDSIPKTIAPHQTYTREFLVDIDRSYLTSETPDSLTFTVEITYGRIPMVFTSQIPVWQAPDLKIRFEPRYHFVKPFPDLEVDRVVSSLNLKAVITKPYDYADTVQVNLETPRGLFAGAYRKELALRPGTISETVRIPFTVSKLFELGIQSQVIELSVDNRRVAADTSRIRIASCEIADTVKIAFMPDSLGMLEDILRMTEAAYRPLTDRSLVTADLDAYNVIVIGSGSFRNYPSFYLIKDRFETYLRQGGSLVIFGQPEDWPGDVLPFSMIPTVEAVTSEEITNRIPEARILSTPYAISEKNLLSSFYKRKRTTPAVITPAERVLVTPRGATLLSVSRLGDGQLIYCGLPLLEMIARLDIDAIHLFANILNY